MDFVERIKTIVNSVPPKQAIPELLALEVNAPVKHKKLARIACLGCLEMEHDWQTIRKLIEEWKLESTFGKELVRRMRKRVGEDEGTPIEDSEILNELDRLNDKNWRVHSPKRNFPNYFENLPQPQPQEKQKDLQEQDSPKQKGILKPRLSRVSFGPIANQEQKPREPPSQNIFRLKFNKNDQQEKPNLQNQKMQAILIPSSIKKPRPQEEPEPKPTTNQTTIEYNIKKAEERIQQKVKMPTTPQKRMQPTNSLKLRYENSKIKDEDDWDDFSFTKSRVPINSLRKNTPKKDSRDTSFMDLSSDSFLRSQMKDDRSEKKKQSVGMYAQKQRRVSNYNVDKPLYTQQQLALINPDIPCKNYIRQIYEAEGRGAMQMFKKRLEEEKKKL